jgi:uncharacterized protein involved in response to NO
MSESSGKRGWRWRHLLDAPHRLGFFLAMVVLGASGLWWAGVQLQRGGWLPLRPMAVSPSLVHAAAMTFGFFPLFFCGFLFAAGPRWLHVRGPTARDLLPALAAQAAGWLLWLAGSHVHPMFAIAGGALAASGLLHATLLLWRLIRASTDEDRLHPIVIAAALTVGCTCIGATALSLLLDAAATARLFVLTGLWGCVAVVFVTAGHRMIPFFTAAPGTMLGAHSDWWSLALLVGAALLQALDVWAPAVRWWLLARALAEMAAGGVLAWSAFAWGRTGRLGNRLMRMFHTGLVWIAVGLLLQGGSGLAAWRWDTAVLPLAPLHAFAMGGFGSLMLAMVTRVSAAHGGLPVAADHFAWALFWLLQTATVLRIAASWPGAAMQPLLTAAALVWTGLVLAWGVRYGSGYGRSAATARQR